MPEAFFNIPFVPLYFLPESHPLHPHSLMADALVSIVLDRLASVIQQQIHHQVSLFVGVESEIQSLANKLQILRAFLPDAEKKQVKDRLVGLWLERLKDMAYQMDDVVDEWSTAILKSQIEGLENASMPTKKKVSSCSLFPCIPSRQEVKRVASRRDIASEIQSIKQQLDEIENERIQFNFSLSDRSDQSYGPVTTAEIDLPVVCGREADKKAILDRLLGHESCQLPVISIVGMGGIGKKTLAQLIFNDRIVKCHFDVRIWVCVSDPFDLIRICRAIVEDLQKESCNLHDWEALQQKVQTCVAGKKFLLVLDDVWSEDRWLWEQLKNCLERGAQGSSVLVTTRNTHVARVMESTYFHHLKPLSDDDSWRLFSTIAFSGRNRDKVEELHEIGKGIVTRCMGFPFTIKTVAGLLSSKDNKEEWESILNSEIWQMDDMVLPLSLLSYDDLPPPIKRCFSFCAIFPNDHIINKENLIRLWMAHSYLNSETSTEMETMGKDYFQILASRSFFKDLEKDKDGNIIRCKMYKHDLAKFLTGNECLIMEVDEEGEVSNYQPFEKGHHASLIVGSNGALPSCICNTENLRTLLNWGGVRIRAASDDLFEYLACLRALELSQNNSIRELPRGLGKLMHLRYLNLSCCRILKELPEEICDLCNLQTLDISGCSELERLPRGMRKLINLRHLANEDTYNLELPKEIRTLTSLRTLSLLILSKDDNACKIGDLRNLDMLRGSLEIRRLEKVKDGGEAEKAKLKKKKHLRHLTLSDGRKKSVIDALQPHPNLKSLEIKWYSGVEYPSWMMNSCLTQLKMLQLTSCYKVRRMPPLGELPLLETLRIRDISNLKYIGDEFLGSSTTIAFPMLKELSFVFMEVWEKWQVEEKEKRSTLPCLSSLEIAYCPKLEALPDCLPRSTTHGELKVRSSPLLKRHYR